MQPQKGFSFIHVIFLILILGFGFVGYILYQQHQESVLNEQSYQTLNNFKTKLDDKMQVAHSTPRIGLGAVLNDLATIKTEISSTVVSECLQPAKQALVSYTEVEVGMMIDFAGNKNKEDDPAPYIAYNEIKMKTQANFDSTMKKCLPK